MYIPPPSSQLRREIDTGFFSIDSVELFFKNIQDNSGPLFLNPFFTLVRVRKTAAVLRVDGEEWSMEPDMIYFFKPGQHISLIRNEGISGNAISFTREFICLHGQASPVILNHVLFHQGPGFSGIKLGPEILEMVDSLSDNLMKEFTGGLELRCGVLGALLGILIVYLIRHIEISGQLYLHSRSEELVNRFYLLLEQEFMTYKLPGQYAARLSVSSNYLNQMVKKVSGCSVGRHIQNRVVLEAKRMALVNEATMKEISYELGFCDPAHFSKYFKRVTGRKFSEFRK